MACSAELYLRRKQLGALDPDTRYIFLSGKPCNQTLLDLYKPHMMIAETPWLAKAYDTCRPLFERTRFHQSFQFQSNEYREYEQGRSTVAFTPEQEELGRRELTKLGIGEKDWFVCLHVRDRAYLDSTVDDSTGWSDYAHDYRNCDVRNFLPAARYIAGKGGFVVRVGAHASAPLSETEPCLVDYVSRHRNDFMDVYLLVKCRFMIGTDSGLSQVASGFDRPLVNTNAVHLDWAGFRSSDLFIQKKVYDARAGRVLSYREILERDSLDIHSTDTFVARGLRLVENTPEEILAAAQEMVERLEGSYHPQPGDDELQRLYRELFGPTHRCHGFPSRLGAHFLRTNRALLLPETLTVDRRTRNS